MLFRSEAFTVLEKVEAQTIEDGQNKNTIPAFWARSHKDGTVATLLQQAADRRFVFGICYNNKFTDAQTFDYAIAALYGGGAVPAGFRVQEITARTWAVFPIIGAMPAAAQETWHKICAEFFPTSSYQPTYEMDVEAYTAGDMTAPDYKSEIWVPVTGKAELA